MSNFSSCWGKSSRSHTVRSTDTEMTGRQLESNTNSSGSSNQSQSYCSNGNNKKKWSQCMLSILLIVMICMMVALLIGLSVWAFPPGHICYFEKRLTSPFDCSRGLPDHPEKISARYLFKVHLADDQPFLESEYYLPFSACLEKCCADEFQTQANYLCRLDETNTHVESVALKKNIRARIGWYIIINIMSLCILAITFALTIVMCQCYQYDLLC